MLDQVNLNKKASKEQAKSELKRLEEELSLIQQEIKKEKLPVVILFDGWGAAGKGSMIADLILNFDPRGCRVISNAPATDEERRRPLLWRYWRNIPEYGQIMVLDRSWYQDVSTARVEDGLSRETVLQRIGDIKIFERQLTDDGYLVLKFFLHISKKEQKKRFDKLEGDKNTEWRVTETDRRRNRNYEDYYRAFDEMLEYTDTPNAPWHLIPSHDRTLAKLEVYHTVLTSIRKALAQKAVPQPAPGKVMIPQTFTLVKMPELADVPLDNALGKDEYNRKLKKLQARLSELHNVLYREKIPVIIGYEGWDAAGKGGNIKRVAAALDPRGYDVHPIASPTPSELAHQYLWRFWTRLPKDGHVAIFDRTWYGRVMVERLEGFCTPQAWHRAYQEINEFERVLTEWGAIVLKFWLHIDQDEQLRRFTDRQNTPSKQWKITDEDWRNREKWPLYEEAVNDMLRYTSTDFAPWHIIQSQDKKYGRIQALELIISAIESRL